MKSNRKDTNRQMQSVKKAVNHNTQTVVLDKIKSAHIEPTNKCIYVLYKGNNNDWQRIKINRK